mmetsp:Transcript_18785/g.66358  ORF Transcript_18785/g.66358 Transcript_18785/m.66358 type:complete len:639 (-) Transcript_18785:101-2017(-)|eukprot:CAMPEP_0203817672 /NCGR_PEP_ID=MMETSP0115-20131106/27518_1 /ASSEMBLY_ACC=CAM_ASM_000227 /TAXON_ID=33651 /ORGANISM="Bicosoecid sp, Strain ms1" /LENGTH=638 /DNA_ID=CAMNT_0050726613 /DNA_START=133 /DNA_END=2049 /DNA_ORIENTATION=-
MSKKAQAHKGGHGFRKGASADNPDRLGRKGNSNLRSKATVQRLQMYKSGKAVRDKKGKILGGTFMSRDRAGNAEITSQTGRTAPNRKWFGNTRVIGQKELDTFREELGAKVHDPYTVVLRQNKLPMSLLADSEKVASMNLLTTETFETTFGPKAQRKKPKVAATDMEALVAKAAASSREFEDKADGWVPGDDELDIAGAAAAMPGYAAPDGPSGAGAGAASTAGAGKGSVAPSTRSFLTPGRFGLKYDDDGTRSEVKEKVLEKGQSRRIWGELYKVLDSSDVVVQVLDARDPMGTRSRHVEAHLKKNAKHKHLMFVLNKCDLVPSWAVKKWVAVLSAEYPTLAFHASMTNPFGKGAFIQLLRQFAKLHSEKQQISVGLIGYPNVGKSSVINALMKKKVCNVAPIPGETKVWQYITLMRRVYLIDCPGVVYDMGDDEATTVLKGVVRSERLESPEDIVPAILARVKDEYLTKVYGVSGWTDAVNFVEMVAKKSGKLRKGGEPDTRNVSMKLINDFQRGKLPWFNAPPEEERAPAKKSDKKKSKAAKAAAKAKTKGTAARGGAGGDVAALEDGEAGSDEGAGAGAGAGGGAARKRRRGADDDGAAKRSRGEKSELEKLTPAQDLSKLPQDSGIGWGDLDM